MSAWGEVRYCTCGAVLKLSASRVAKRLVLSQWTAWHTGDGHEPTDAKGARKGQRAAEREAARQERLEAA